jgi:hypothetical protein
MDDLGVGVVGVGYGPSPQRLVIHRDHPTGQAHGVKGLAAPIRADLCVQLAAQLCHLLPENWPTKSYSVELGMRCAKPHSVKLSTARQLRRFVKNPQKTACMRMWNVHRRPFGCRGSLTNRLKSHAGLRKMRCKQGWDRSRNFR